jgi:hypothetical protein
MQVIATFASLVLYIWSTYFYDEDPVWMINMEYALISVFMLDYLFQFYVSFSR